MNELAHGIHFLGDVHLTVADSGAFHDPARAAEAAGVMANLARDGQPVVNLGDLIDAPGTAAATSALAQFSTLLGTAGSRAASRVLHVPGNHCLDHLDAGAFARVTGGPHLPATLDLAHGLGRLLLLDTCWTSSGEPYGSRPDLHPDWTDAHLPRAQLDAVDRACRGTPGVLVVGVHHRLDLAWRYAVRNADALREVLSARRGPTVVVQGHSHRAMRMRLDGVDYLTLPAAKDAVRVADAVRTLRVLPGGRWSWGPLGSAR